MSERTEEEIMLAGEMYLSSDPALVAARLRARRLTRLFNATTEEEPARRREILSELFGVATDRIEIEPPFHCDYGIYAKIGAGFFANFGLVILDCNYVTIGSDVKCGPRVQIIAATHPVDPVARASGRELAFPVTIGDGVWLGAGAIICPGVTIGSGTTVGAGSVVNRDLPANVVAAGVPCRVLRTLG